MDNYVLSGNADFDPTQPFTSEQKAHLAKMFDLVEGVNFLLQKEQYAEVDEILMALKAPDLRALLVIACGAIDRTALLVGRLSSQIDPS